MFTEGSLGRAIGVTPAQFPEIEKRCNELEQSLASETQRIRQSCFNATLEQLTLEQRRKAREILGEYFEFPKSHFAYEHEEYKLLLELKEQ